MAETTYEQEKAASLRQESEQLLESAREKGEHVAMEQKMVLAGAVSRLVGALHRTARNLEEEHDSATARYFGMAADGLDRFSSSLRKRDLNTLLSQSQEFARRHPAVVFGGAMAAGFMVSRLMKSSPARRGRAEAGAAEPSAFTAESRTEGMGINETEVRKSRPYGAVKAGDYSGET